MNGKHMLTKRPGIQGIKKDTVDSSSIQAKVQQNAVNIHMKVMMIVLYLTFPKRIAPRIINDAQ